MMTKDNSIHIVLASSNEFVPYCATTMASILYNVAKDRYVHFYILTYDITVKNKKKLDKLKKIKDCSIEYPQFDEKLLDMFEGIHLPEHVTKMTYARILIPDILPDVDKAIFIDSDTIVREDISKLYDTDIGDNCFAMVEDVNFKNLAKRLWGEQDLSYYFNAGVMLINSFRLRNIAYLDKIKKHISLNGDKYKICDQDVINDTFKGEILRISLTWNCYHKIFVERFHCYAPDNIDEFYKICNNPAVVHFVGPEKPWLSNVKHQFKAEYYTYNRLTPYYKHPSLLQSLNKKLSQKLKKFMFSSYVKNNVYKLKIMGISVLTKKNTREKRSITIFGLPIYYKDRTYEVLIEVINYRIKCVSQQLSEQQKINGLINRKLSNLKCTIEAQKMHEKTFGSYKNTFKGKNVVLVCSGPTAKNYKMIDNAIHIGVNGAIYLENIKLDYVFAQDYTIHQLNNETLIEDVIAYSGNNCKKFLGIIPDDRLRAVYRHVERIPLRLIDKENISQYLLEDWNMHSIAYDLSKEPLGDFCGTVFSALQFILYTHPQRLYLVGWDCGAGYAYNKNQYAGSANYQIDILKRYFLPFIRVNYPDVEIISVNPVGLKGIFNDVYTSEYRSKV